MQNVVHSVLHDLNKEEYQVDILRASKHPNSSLKLVLLMMLCDTSVL